MGILEVQNVNKSFGGLKALQNVNLDIEEGTIHAIIGPNGAGKSTLLNCFVGKLIPDTGTVMFDGHSLLGRKPHEINQIGVSRVFQTPEIFSDLSVLENVLIPCFAKRDGAFTLNALARVTGETDVREKAEQMLICSRPPRRSWRRDLPSVTWLPMARVAIPAGDCCPSISRRLF